MTTSTGDLLREIGRRRMAGGHADLIVDIAHDLTSTAVKETA